MLGSPCCSRDHKTNQTENTLENGSRRSGLGRSRREIREGSGQDPDQTEFDMYIRLSII